MDKAYTKVIFEKANIKQAKYEYIVSKKQRLSRNDKRGRVAYIYTLSNDPTPFPAIPPGGGWLERKTFGTGIYFNLAGGL